MFVHPRQVGQAAAAALIALVEGGVAENRTIEVPVRLNARASTARAAS
jgi:DNA-binding LacI/PurR family transcriptional regulator